MSETQEAPRRLRAADVIDNLQATIAALTERRTSGSPQVGAELTRNAKKETQIAVKVTANMDADLDELRAHAAAVLDIAMGEYKRATMNYPSASGYPTEDGAPKDAGE